jgi:hypothetical protein
VGPAAGRRRHRRGAEDDEDSPEYAQHGSIRRIKSPVQWPDANIRISSLRRIGTLVWHEVSVPSVAPTTDTAYRIARSPSASTGQPAGVAW